MAEQPALLNGRYQLLEQLGSGGMADVFRARDPVLDRYVAIKILRKDFSVSEEFQKNFRLEARAAANLSHPNIVTVHDFGFADDLLFIVMELIPGKDLKQLIRERGRFSVETGVPLMAQACAGIGYAHRAGIVHCDVKPHNMLVAKDGRLKVTDFGIARALATVSQGERAKVVWGSPLYFAPEQAAGEAPTPASDVYSLGVVMYELLTGAPPFTAGSAEELARLHISARPIPISEYLPDIPPALEEIVMKVLSKEPSARYRTADQLGRVLMQFGAKRDALSPANLAPVSAQPAPAAIPIQPEIARRLAGKPSVPQPVPAPRPAAPDDSPSAWEQFDWITIALALVALLAVGGLIPFWMIVFNTIF